MASEKVEVKVVVDESAAVKGIAALDKSMSNIATSLALLEGSIGKMTGLMSSLATTSGGSTAGSIQGLTGDMLGLVDSVESVAGLFSETTGVLGKVSAGILSVTGPVGTVLSGFSTMLSVGSELVGWFNEMEEKYRGESELLKETRSQIEQSVSGMEELISARQRNVENGMGEIAMTEMLYGKLAEMADANGIISAADTERAQILAEKLNPALGETIQLNQDGSATLLKSADDVKTYLEQKKAQMIVEAMEPEVKYALVESTKLYNAMMENSSQIEANNAKIKENNIAYQKAEAEGNYELMNQLANANLALLEDNEARMESNDEMLASYEEYTKTIGEYDANMTALMLGDSQAIVEGKASEVYAQEETNENVKELYGQRVVDAQGCLDTLHAIHEDDAVDLGDSIYAAAEERLDTVNDAYLNLGASAVNGLNTGIDETEPSASENAAQMVDQANGAAAAETTDFKTTGNEAGNQYKQGMAEKNPEVQQESKAGFEAVGEKAKEANFKYTEAGTGAAEGFKGSLAEQRAQLETYVHDYFAGMGDKAKKGLQINSPSKIFKQIGLSVGEGFRAGMELDKPKAVRTVLDYFKKMVSTVEAENGKLNLTFASSAGMYRFAGRELSLQDKVITQTINFNQPVQTPAQMARALRRESKQLARGVY